MFVLMIYTDGAFGLLVPCDGWIHWALDSIKVLTFYPYSFPLLYMLYGVGSIQPFLLSCRLSFGTEWLVSCLFASAALHHDPFAYPAHVLALLVFVPSIYESD